MELLNSSKTTGQHRQVLRSASTSMRVSSTIKDQWILRRGITQVINKNSKDLCSSSLTSHGLNSYPITQSPHWHQFWNEAIFKIGAVRAVVSFSVFLHEGNFFVRETTPRRFIILKLTADLDGREENRFGARPSVLSAMVAQRRRRRWRRRRRQLGGLLLWLQDTFDRDRRDKQRGRNDRCQLSVVDIGRGRATRRDRG